jgi:hypothetical protein
LTRIPGHYIVVASIRGDGTAAGTEAYVLDPARGEAWMPYINLQQLYEADPASIMMQYPH